MQDSVRLPALGRVCETSESAEFVPRMAQCVPVAALSERTADVHEP